jgi:hypothetical protein
MWSTVSDHQLTRVVCSSCGVGIGDVLISEFSLNPLLTRLKAMGMGMGNGKPPSCV